MRIDFHTSLRLRVLDSNPISQVSYQSPNHVRIQVTVPSSCCTFAVDMQEFVGPDAMPTPFFCRPYNTGTFVKTKISQALIHLIHTQGTRIFRTVYGQL
jgi:hypothetical protein